MDVQELSPVARKLDRSFKGLRRLSERSQEGSPRFRWAFLQGHPLDTIRNDGQAQEAILQLFQEGVRDAGELLLRVYGPFVMDHHERRTPQASR